MINIEKYITEKKSSLISVEQIDTALKLLRADGTIDLNSYVMPEKDGFSVSLKMSAVFDDFLNLMTKIYPLTNYENLLIDANTHPSENDFWTIVGAYLKSSNDNITELGCITSLEEEQQKKIFNYTFYNHVLCRSPIRESENGLNFAEIAAAYKALMFSFNFVFMSFRNKSDFINGMLCEFNIQREICHYIWELFQDNRDDLRYQAIISNINL